MYLFDDVIRPLNNWALYKNSYCEGVVDESSILELFIRGLLSSFKDGGDHSPSYLCVFQF